ncbi:MAG: serine--tRNA ligase, partial [Bacteroidetes bacterium]|nr:serine--tRNA ligase [Bacteroidota bacterium]
MLALHYIRENKEAIRDGLKKRNFKSPEKIDKILELDQNRRARQAVLDQHLAKANALAKEIGSLFKSGEQEKANELKKETSSLKELSKT